MICDVVLGVFLRSFSSRFSAALARLPTWSGFCRGPAGIAWHIIWSTVVGLRHLKSPNGR